MDIYQVSHKKLHQVSREILKNKIPNGSQHPEEINIKNFSQNHKKYIQIVLQNPHK